MDRFYWDPDKKTLYQIDYQYVDGTHEKVRFDLGLEEVVNDLMQRIDRLEDTVQWLTENHHDH